MDFASSLSALATLGLRWAAGCSLVALAAIFLCAALSIPRLSSSSLEAAAGAAAADGNGQRPAVASLAGRPSQTSAPTGPASTSGRLEGVPSELLEPTNLMIAYKVPAEGLGPA